MRPLGEGNYQDKLNTLAESFKNLSLEFDDDEEDDFDTEIKNFGYNLLSRSGFDEIADT